LRIRFIKCGGGDHEIQVTGRRRGPDLRRPRRETGPTLPHDLVHAVVEEALKLEPGFWDSVDAGATYDGFVPLVPGRHRRSGLAPLARLSERAFPAEVAVSWAHRHWSGQRTRGRGLGPCPLSSAQLARAAAALDEAQARWSSLEEGESLVVEWARAAK